MKIVSFHLSAVDPANVSKDQQAIETLLNIAEQYADHGKNITQQGAGAVKGAHGDSALTTAEADLKVCFWL